jgi:hypothetical protein
MKDAPKIKISFGAAPIEDPHSPDMASGKDSSQGGVPDEVMAKLKMVRDAVVNGDKQKALSLLDDCVNSYGKEESSEGEGQEGGDLDSKLDEILSKAYQK